MKRKQVPELVHESKRIVVKIGSALVVEKGIINEKWLVELVSDVSELKKHGHEIIIVTSGAIAMGRKALGISHEVPRSAIPLELEQAAAAVGQIHLILAYHLAFSVYEINAAQVLLSPHDTENRRSHLNARATINTLINKGVIPIINENDSVVTEEIKFGDNDRLAARVAQMAEADLVILLSTTDGLYTADPKVDGNAEHIPFVEKLESRHLDMAGETRDCISTGGMKSKLEAVKLATNAGASFIIADGREPNSLAKLSEDPGIRTTWFQANGDPANARKRWIQSHIKTEGVLVIDDGAAKALNNGKSLLPIGVVEVAGDFGRGDAVSVKHTSGEILAIGLMCFNSYEAGKIAGRKSGELAAILGYSGRSEMIHRNDMALMITPDRNPSSS